jgi:hypothetical protein
MSTVTLICRCCKTQFEYAKKEFNRQTKLGRKEDEFYCSKKCARSWKNSHRPESEKTAYYEKQSLRLKGNKFAKKGIFTHHLNKARNRNKDFDLDEEYLASIWTGRCSLSGIIIVNEHRRSSLKSASLDRIDSTKGYVKGNVQFVSYGINLAKNSFSDEEVLQFIHDIKSK